ncbi:MAG: metal-dependent transcriptional regulator, partial [Desulfobacterales bacterium]|nr:metal-dependent transcriptional regulator [Desulfobacterales bacterium]
ILNVDFKKADEEACKMEHAVSASTLDRFIEFMEFVQFCPRVGLDWLEYFDEYRLHGQEPDKCLARMKEFAGGFKVRIKTMEEVGGEK